MVTVTLRTVAARGLLLVVVVAAAAAGGAVRGQEAFYDGGDVSVLLRRRE